MKLIRYLLKSFKSKNKEEESVPVMVSDTDCEIPGCKGVVKHRNKKSYVKQCNSCHRSWII